MQMPQFLSGLFGRPKTTVGTSGHNTVYDPSPVFGGVVSIFPANHQVVKDPLAGSTHIQVTHTPTIPGTVHPTHTAAGAKSNLRHNAGVFI